MRAKYLLVGVLAILLAVGGLLVFLQPSQPSGCPAFLSNSVLRAPAYPQELRSHHHLLSPGAAEMA